MGDLKTMLQPNIFQLCKGMKYKARMLKGCDRKDLLMSFRWAPGLYWEQAWKPFV